MDIRHEDGGEETTLVLNHDESYALAMALVRASDHDFNFLEWRIQSLRDWSVKTIDPPDGSKDRERSYLKKSP